MRTSQGVGRFCGLLVHKSARPLRLTFGDSYPVPSKMTPRARRRLRRTRRHKVSKVLLGLVVLAASAAIAALSFGLWVLGVAAEAPPIEELKPIDKGQNSVVLAADGSRLGYVESDVLRTPVPIEEIPKDMQEATIAIEDERFYEHDGVDINAIVRDRKSVV